MSASANNSIQDLIVYFDPECGYCAYEGPRAVLEAEGLIPEGTQWPKGYLKCCWDSGVFLFSLSRKRAPGSRGRQRDGDWWKLHWVHRDPLHFGRMRIRLRMQELERMMRLYSPQGDPRGRSESSLYMSACADKRFQAFKAMVPGLVRPSRRTTKSAASQEELSNRGAA